MVKPTINAVASSALLFALCASWVLWNQAGALHVLQALVWLQLGLLAFLILGGLKGWTKSAPLPTRSQIDRSISLITSAVVAVLLIWHGFVLTGLACIVGSVMDEALRNKDGADQ